MARPSQPSGSRIFGFFRIGPVEQGHVADPLHHFRAGRGRQFGQQLIPHVTVADPGAHLDQFVVRECAVQFGDQVGAEAGIAHEDDRVEVVA